MRKYEVPGRAASEISNGNVSPVRHDAATGITRLSGGQTLATVLDIRRIHLDPM